MTAEWLGHRDLCSIQWSDICDCDPDNPIDFSGVGLQCQDTGDCPGLDRCQRPECADQL